MIAEIAIFLPGFLVLEMNNTPGEKKGSGYRIEDLIYLMRRLRDPEGGCPWDLEQTYKTIVPSTIEEAYEVADAIERDDLSALKEELGDYLFQAVFYSQLASEQRLWGMDDVIDGLVSKLVRRHPHVFPEGTLESRKEASDKDQTLIKQRWEELKQEEREAKGLAGAFDDVPKSLPALSRAQKIQKRAARQRFDWKSVEPVYDKIAEEVSELQQAVDGQNQDAIEAELGDLIFTCVNLARHLKVDAETALRRSTNKFRDRYLAMQDIFLQTGSGQTFESLSADEMEALWRAAKERENSSDPVE